MTIGAETESLDKYVPNSSQAWDRQAASAHTDELAVHLESVAESSPIQLATRHAIELMCLRDGYKVLDAGCGSGSIFAALTKVLGPTGEIVGIDHAPEFFDLARRGHESAGSATPLTLVEADVHAIPLDDASFDAAHCERVLIHVIDPQLALRELRRVVRPGGWVVAVEPDLAGWRIDHEDNESASKITAAFIQSIRNPGMGLELNRRMAEVGLVNRQVRFVTEIETAIDSDLVPYYENAAKSAVERGLLSSSQARTTVDALLKQAEFGRFTSYSTMFVWAGQVPA